MRQGWHFLDPNTLRFWSGDNWTLTRTLDEFIYWNAMKHEEAIEKELAAIRPAVEEYRMDGNVPGFTIDQLRAEILARKLRERTAAATEKQTKLEKERRQGRTALVVTAVIIGVIALVIAGRTAQRGEPSARCADGTTSYSQTAQGTCSHHGGVSEWISGTDDDSSGAEDEFQRQQLENIQR